MGLADKLGDFFLEKDPAKEDRSTPSTRPVAPPPLMSRTIPVADGLTLDQGIAVEMRNRLGQRRKTAAGWEKIQALKAACATLAKYVPDKTAQVRAALETQGLDVNALIEYCTGVLNVLANEDARFRAAIDEERAKARPAQQKNIDDVAISLAAAKTKVAELTEQLSTMKISIQMSEERLGATEAAFASALADVRKETNDELEQLKSLR